jgi:hypothetical protein
MSLYYTNVSIALSVIKTHNGILMLETLSEMLKNAFTYVGGKIVLTSV